MMLSFMQVISNLTGARMNYEVSVRDSSGASSRSSNTIVPQTTAPMNLNTLLESVVEATISTTASPDSLNLSVQEQLTELQRAYQTLEARVRTLEAKLVQQERAPAEPAEPADPAEPEVASRDAVLV